MLQETMPSMIRNLETYVALPGLVCSHESHRLQQSALFNEQIPAQPARLRGHL